MSGDLQKRSMRIAGHRTSLALEAEFWAAVEVMAREREQTLPVFFAEIDKAKPATRSLASAVRVMALTGKHPGERRAAA